MAHLIYGLFDPREPKVIKYVGYTSYTIEYRLSQHVAEAKQGKKTYRCNWIRSLLTAGVQPNVKLLEEVTEDNWQEREKHWIDVYADTVTNGTAGGEGLVNPSQEVRSRIAAKISVISKGNQHRKGIRHTEESKRAIREGMLNSDKVRLAAEKRKGIPLVIATEASRVICTGVAKTEEHRRKISEAMKSSDSMQKAALKRTGIKLPGASAKKQGSRFINDGKMVKQLKAGEPLPEGWVYGMKLKGE